MTVTEALTAIKNRLQDVEIKVSDMEKVGLPVLMSIKDINSVIEALSQTAEKDESSQEEEI